MRRSDLMILGTALVGIGAASLTLMRAEGVTLSRANPVGKVASGADPLPQDATATHASSPSLTYYTSGVRSNLFGDPAPPPVITPKPAPAQAAAVEVPAPSIDPLMDYALVGQCTIGKERYVLLENRYTKEGVYLKQGDVFQGYEVKQTKGESLMLESEDDTRTLAMNEEYSLTPLSQNAAYLNPAPVLGKPGATGPSLKDARAAKAAMAPISEKRAQRLREKTLNSYFDGKMSYEKYQKKLQQINGSVVPDRSGAKTKRR